MFFLTYFNNKNNLNTKVMNKNISFIVKHLDNKNNFYYYAKTFFYKFL